MIEQFKLYNHSIIKIYQYIGSVFFLFWILLIIFGFKNYGLNGDVILAIVFGIILLGVNYILYKVNTSIDCNGRIIVVTRHFLNLKSEIRIHFDNITEANRGTAGVKFYLNNGNVIGPIMYLEDKDNVFGISKLNEVDKGKETLSRFSDFVNKNLRA